MLDWQEEDMLETDSKDAVELVSYRRNIQARQQAAQDPEDEGVEQSD